MQAPISEVLIDVDRCAVDDVAPTKAAIDRGCSLSKFLYIAKDSDLTLPVYTFHCTLFRNEDFEDGLRFLKEKAILPANGKLRITGVGCDMYEEKIREILGLETEFVDEAASNVKGLHFLLSHAASPEELFFPKLEILDDKGIERPEDLNAMLQKMREDMSANNGPDPDAKFPCVFILLGSATVSTLIDKDGSFHFLGMDMVGGRSLLGLGKALVGTNSYDEIMELAKKGNVNNVDTTIGEFLKDDPNSPYGRFRKDLPLFSFGKLVASDLQLEDFDRADRASSLVRVMALNIHSLMLASVKAASVTRVVFGGNGIRSEVLRQKIVDQDAVNGSKDIVDAKFLKTGHTGAFGAMTSSTVSSLKKV